MPPNSDDRSSSTVSPPTADARWQAACRVTPPSWPSDDPAFLAAEAIRNGDPLVRGELEARALANQPAGDLALAMGLPVDVVRHYEFSFFDVRRHLRDSEWISRAVPGCCGSDELRCRDVDLLWRRVAHHAGLPFLLPILELGDRGHVRKSDIRTYLRPRTPLAARIKVQIAQECLPYLKTSEGMKRLWLLSAGDDWESYLTYAELKSPMLRQVIKLYLAAFRGIIFVSAMDRRATSVRPPSAVRH